MIPEQVQERVKKRMRLRKKAMRVLRGALGRSVEVLYSTKRGQRRTWKAAIESDGLILSYWPIDEIEWIRWEAIEEDMKKAISVFAVRVRLRIAAAQMCRPD